MASRNTVSLDTLNLNDSMPKRPAFGTRGNPVTLWANYVELTPAANLTLHRYAIAVSPDAAGKKLTQIIRLLLEAPELASRKDDIVTDFKSTLFSRQKFSGNDTIIKIAYRAENEDAPLEGAREYQVRLRYTGTFNSQDLVQYLTSTNWGAQYQNKQPMIQAFDIFMNHFSKSTGNLVAVGSSKTFSLADGADSWNLGSGLTAIRGFFASVRAATARILVNVNVSHGAFYDSGPLLGLMTAYGMGNKIRLNSFVRRLRIKTTHLPERKNRKGQVIPRIKTILGVATQNDGHGLPHPPQVKKYAAGANEVFFWLEENPGTDNARPSNGRYVSVADFFHFSMLSFPFFPTYWAVVTD